VCVCLCVCAVDWQQMLEEICVKNGWGAPSYELHEVVAGVDNKLYIYKVLPLLFRSFFSFSDLPVPISLITISFCIFFIVLHNTTSILVSLVSFPFRTFSILFSFVLD